MLVIKWVTGVFSEGLACSFIRSHLSQTHRLRLSLPDMPCHASLGISAFVHPSSLSSRGDYSQIDATFNFYSSLPFWPTDTPLCVYSTQDRESIGQTRNQQSTFVLQGMYSQSCVRGGFSIFFSTCVDERMRQSATVNNLSVL